MPEGSGVTPLAPVETSGPEGVTVVFDQPESVPGTKGQDPFYIKRVAEGVGEHDGPGLPGQCLFQEATIHVAVRKGHIEEDRHPLRPE